ncbi:sigma-70 family RNA polymerase sigma factor [Frankia sp. CNm7]|uniref:Sigma-70 family RNA polymerase sigma factor n=1 Tax=Frankia nepalensis TaxID=1836974 RepID=A0A937RUU0_9ACTN|nr:sigma-70 family RNA polymerase sigma factor [Frankia nepalensis]MBL7502815.1 sigma-70 family RNA polymerase sigma factor [Frankia nepalensis]MBL7515270.1 sigma-70 family RNA polymerase sigma factor [Frankia nepalensis]MBL7522128.1 sigma-70 family RNA polymerase sigma factor [Frankia nepalensis]MBL7632291.1 sigma-70 family RNA polymerase sigma factor [Frankia nepalensis]
MNYWGRRKGTCRNRDQKGRAVNDDIARWRSSSVSQLEGPAASGDRRDATSPDVQKDEPDRSLLETLYTEHWEGLHWYLVSQGCPPGEAEDFVHDGIKILLVNWDTLQCPENARAYWYKTSFRLMRRSLKLRRERLTTDDPAHRLQALPDSADTLADIDIRRAAVDIVGNLPLRQRQVFWLRAVEDFSVEETARVLQITPGTVKSNYHDAKKNVEKLVNEAGGRSGGGASR